MKMTVLPGNRYGRLVVCARDGRRAVCVCDCGKTLRVWACSLPSGNTKSCGCYAMDVWTDASSKFRRHGMCSTPTYKSWNAAIQRCCNKNDPSYPRYGGRGVRMHEAWRHDFNAFLSDMGERPDGKTLDRIDVNGNYEPGNCRWATASEQARNRSSGLFVEFAGKRTRVIDLCEQHGYDYRRVVQRLKRGWSIEESIR